MDLKSGFEMRRAHDKRYYDNQYVFKAVQTQELKLIGDLI